MAIHSDFQVAIKNGKIEKQLRFSDDNSQISPMFCLEIFEYLDTRICFRGDAKYRLYIEGYENVFSETNEQNELLVDENDTIYYTPSETEIILYNSNINEASYTMIPGYYEIKVESPTNIYYSWLRVVPKNLSIQEWEEMKNDIENTIKGLALEILERKIGYQDYEDGEKYKPDILNKTELFIKEASKIMNYLKLIDEQPKFEVQKEYKKIQSQRVQVDKKSLILTARKSVQKDRDFGINRTIQYDISVNKIMKSQIIYIKSELNKILKYLIKYENNLVQSTKYERNQVKINKQNSGIVSRIEVIQRLLFNIELFLNKEWVSNINEISIGSISMPYLLDIRYRYISGLYDSIVHQKFRVKLHQKYEFYWKRSDVLYEIWSFITLLKSLMLDDFIPISGWIYDNNSLITPFLNDNDRVTLYREKDNIRISLVYNAHLNKSYKNVTINNPLFTSRRNNKPDIRMDINKDNRYIGGLIFDCKYSPLRNVWKNWNTKNPKSADYVKNQLRNYRDIQHPLYQADIPVEKRKSFIKPLEVWVLYAGEESVKYKDYIYTSERINCESFTPVVSLKNFQKKISKKIEELIELDTYTYGNK